MIQNYCTPNALLTLAEYLADYASPETRAAGERLITAEIARLGGAGVTAELEARLERVRSHDERDLYF